MKNHIYGSFATLLLLWLVIGCTVSYSFTGGSIDYTRVKSIQITDFPIRPNDGSEVYAPLGTAFNEGLKDMYARQTKLQQVTTEGDLAIEGEIVGYNTTNESVSADGYSSKVRLTVTVNVRYTNNTNHEEDFERQFSAFRTYDATQNKMDVQDQLIDEMVKEITDQIFNATVANW
ncbi:MAG: LPS assembly lipoprotein LptE [Prevotellaceae bacterium]|jgi:hypothetical protein|nr:LPS assembly lipoprotein LptE [Prevotellaceae bacterium]